MWQKFTERARRVILLGQREAARANSPHVGTEHLFLGLIADGDCFAAQALEKCGVNLTAVAASVKSACGSAPGIPAIIAADLKLTLEGKETLADVATQARQLGHEYIGTGHLLLALIKRPQSLAVEALRQQGVTPENVREELVKTLSSSSQQDSTGEPPTMWEKFTPRAQAVMVRSLDEAAQRASVRIGLEFLFLSLLSDPASCAVQLLQSSGVNLAEIAEEVRAVTGPPAPQPGKEEPKMTPDAKHAVKVAADEARRLGHDYLGTEHLLLALLRAPNGTVARLMANRGHTLETMREQVVRTLGPARPSPNIDNGEPAPGRTAQNPESAPAAAGPASKWRTLFSFPKRSRPKDH